ncbi:adenylate cyclase [Rhizobiales bacterium GAS188]|nr:adenylate cyclase [Rhizobiales bacterium GAS188]
MDRGRMDARTTALFAGAERSAERVVGQLRMAAALSLGAVFAITVVAHAQRDDAVLSVQIAAAATTLVAYLGLGALSYHVAVPHRFRSWMPWAFVTGDAGFLLINVGLKVFMTGIGGDDLASFPELWFAPLVLAFGALQYNPARLAYATALLAGGLVAIAAVGSPFDALTDTPPAAIGRFFDAPPNIMRLAMLAAAGAILVAAAARMRSLLQRAIDETRRRANLTRYLPAEIADQLAESGLAALREGRRQAVAVMFVDIRGFTRRAETMDPAATGRLLADFRRFVVATATRHEGIVDKFIGDSAMLVFGLPSPRPDDARRALNCALALLAGTPGGWARDLETGGSGAIEIGIGLHAGDAFCGAVGDEARLEFSVLGDTVNVAARLEQETKTVGLRLVVSRNFLATAGETADGREWQPLGSRTLRGRARAVDLFGAQPFQQRSANGEECADSRTARRALG